MKTVLCVPGHDEAKVKKCRQYGADLILFDLEDSVPDSMKDRAREIVAANVTTGDAVRINHRTTYRAYDDAEMVRASASCVWLPKSNNINGLRELTHYFKQRISVVWIVETPRLVLELSRIDANDLLTFSPDGLAFGAADFAAYMNVPASSPQVQYARQQVALTAAALGIPAYDSPCTWLDPETVADESYSAYELGYQWKGVVHPSQIPYVRSEDGHPSPIVDKQLIDWYERQSEAVVVDADGEVIAPPMIRAARKRLEEADGYIRD